MLVFDHVIGKLLKKPNSKIKSSVLLLENLVILRNIFTLKSYFNKYKYFDILPI